MAKTNAQKKVDMAKALEPVSAGPYKMMFVPKVDRAREAVKKAGGDPTDDALVLVEYDKLGGLVLDAEGNKMPYKHFVNEAAEKAKKKANDKKKADDK